MARPAKVRTTETFARDLKTMAHLRTAILIDGDLDAGRAKTAVKHIDDLTEILLEFSREKDSNSWKIKEV